MKPVILITLHRRYEDLRKNLEIIAERVGEFREPPDLGVIWSTPEEDIDYFIQQLFEKYDFFKFIIYRPKLEREGQGGGTTYPESHNINIGLKFIKDYYGDNAYGIVQATDVNPLRNAYKEIDDLITEGHNAVLYYWHNQCLNQPAFSTYFFGIKLEEKFWPPVATYDSHDALEWTWAKIAYGIIKPEGKEMWGYAIFPPNRRFEVGNLPTGTIPFMHHNAVGFSMRGKTKFGIKIENIMNWFKYKILRVKH